MHFYKLILHLLPQLHDIRHIAFLECGQKCICVLRPLKSFSNPLSHFRHFLTTFFSLLPSRLNNLSLHWLLHRFRSFRLFCLLFDFFRLRRFLLNFLLNFLLDLLFLSTLSRCLFRRIYYKQRSTHRYVSSFLC